MEIPIFAARSKISAYRDQSAVDHDLAGVGIMGVGRFGNDQRPAVQFVTVAGVTAADAGQSGLIIALAHGAQREGAFAPFHTQRLVAGRRFPNRLRSGRWGRLATAKKSLQPVHGRLAVRSNSDPELRPSSCKNRKLHSVVGSYVATAIWIEGPESGVT